MPLYPRSGRAGFFPEFSFDDSIFKIFKILSRTFLKNPRAAEPDFFENFPQQESLFFRILS